VVNEYASTTNTFSLGDPRVRGRGQSESLQEMGRLRSRSDFQYITGIAYLMLLFFSCLGEWQNWEPEAEIHRLARGAEAGREGKDTGESG